MEVGERKEEDEADRVAADDPVVAQNMLASLTSFIVCSFLPCLVDVADIHRHSGILLPPPLHPLPPPKLELELEFKLLNTLRLCFSYDDALPPATTPADHC
jgi:hypothetical protein